VKGIEMATEQLDARTLLAKMEAEEKAARDKADQLVAENAKKRKELLEQLRKADLEDVKAKCKLHGFTASDLRGVLKTRGGGASKSTPRKSGGKRAATKSTSKNADK
jgi:hypothetical protein